MTPALDEIDLRLLYELQCDADRPNVALARLVGLSPAATLNRVKRLKETGVITGIHARLDAEAAGFPLQVYISLTLASHSEKAERRFADTVRSIPQVIAADWVAGQTDALLKVAARDLSELQEVIAALASRGGAGRIVTLLRLQTLKADGALPLGSDRPQPLAARRRAAGVAGAD